MRSPENPPDIYRDAATGEFRITGPSLVQPYIAQAIQGAQLQPLEAHDKAWVFPSPEGVPYSRVHISRVFRKAACGAGLRDFHFHDLRHHGATMALNANFSAPIVQQLGGCKTERMMRRYAAVTDKTLRAAAEAVSGNGGWQLTAKPAAVVTRESPSQG